jgi:protease II
MRQGALGKDEVLVDPNTLSGDATTSVQLAGVSWDGKIVLYGIRHGGEDETEVKLMNVESRRALPDAMPRARYMGFSVKPDDRGFYYSKFIPGKGTRAYLHTIGTDIGTDKEIFGGAYGPGHFVSVRSRRSTGRRSCPRGNRQSRARRPRAGAFSWHTWRTSLPASNNSTSMGNTSET